jgi:tRNA U34 5-methylaminomethyl-2-thiouridine-forming methyltransferase MnmC
MQKLLQLTEDGSHTIQLPEMGVTYHSNHGAIAESRHVYIEAGLNYLLLDQEKATKISVLEMGFGTGLNALLSLQWARANSIAINYTSIESDPLQQIEYTALNYGSFLNLPHELQALHEAEWNVTVQIDALFSVEKLQTSLVAFQSEQQFNCLFFDAFSPLDQPELWTTEIFLKLYRTMLPGAVLLTYCSKSVVRKAMQEAGLQVTKIPGPYGKREMVRAIRLS